MGETKYVEVFDSVLFKGNSSEMYSAADQDSFINRRDSSPLWQPTWESRSTYPFWERGDILRNVTFESTQSLGFSVPKVSYPASVVSPTGEIVMHEVSKPTPLMLPDNVKYHHNAQKLFALMSQFNVLTEQQIASFLGVSIAEAHHYALVLHSSGVLESPTGVWVYEDTVGKIWRLRMGTPDFLSYYDGMDTLWKILSLGGGSGEDWVVSPGAHTASAARHNLFIAEISLRLAEVCDNVIGVWGDFFASEELFHTQRDGVKRRKSHGDAILVTRDGGLVVLELSTHVMSWGGNHTRVIAEKAASWLGVIANTDLDISVIFIDTRWSSNKKPLYRSIMSGVYDIGPSYAPDRYRRKEAEEKIGLVNAAWWFPAEGAVSRAATRLTAYNPMRHKFSMFDQPNSFFSDDAHRKNVVVNTMSSLHNPQWIADGFRKRDFYAS